MFQHCARILSLLTRPSHKFTWEEQNGKEDTTDPLLLLRAYTAHRLPWPAIRTPADLLRFKTMLRPRKAAAPKIIWEGSAQEHKV